MVQNNKIYKNIRGGVNTYIFFITFSVIPSHRTI